MDPWLTRGPGVAHAPSISGGREELRATLLKPYLLQLRSERGDAAARTLLSTGGLPGSVLEDETIWISLGAARRVLRALAASLGEQAILHCSPWLIHSEALGAYVQMLRVSAQPIDAYRYLLVHSAESSRVGNYRLGEARRGRIEASYVPAAGMESGQEDRLLCHVRRAELESIPLFWGLPPAIIEHPRCLADGAQSCQYVVRWHEQTPRNLWFGAAGGTLACAGSAAMSGNLVAVGIGAVVGALLGATIGALADRIGRDRGARILQRHRIAALERGLELRGLQRLPEGDLSGSLLGGKYRILRRIGSGGIGTVYAATHLTLGHQVAIKLLRGAAAADAAETARLRREAQVQVSIEHPNVVRTFDLDQTPDGSIYVVMEMLQGVSLARRLREGPIASGQAVPIFISICRALEAAHRLGVVHRDLKPANVYLCDDGAIKVLDFGMSKFAQAESLTQDGYTLGTPEYMSPEQCVGASVDGRSDLYALGTLMYEALTGDIPLGSHNRRDLLELQQHALPTPMRDRRPDLNIHPELDALVLRCLAKRASQRPQNARQLADLLAALPISELATSLPADLARQAPVDGTGQQEVRPARAPVK